MKHILLSIMTATVLTFLMSACGVEAELPRYDVAGNLDASSTPAAIIRAEMLLHPEVTDTTLLRSINLRGVNGDRYYLASRNTLMVFGPDGRCISSFSREGNGPGEYVNPKCVWARKSTGGWAVGVWPDRMMNYSIDGTFTGTDTIGDVSSLMPLGRGWIATNSSLKDTDVVLYYFDSEWHLTDSLVTPVKHRVYEIPGGYASFNPTLITCGDRAVIEQNDTLFDVSSPAAGRIPVGVINLGDKKRPADMSPAEYDEEGRYITPGFAMTDRHLMVSFYYAGTNYIQIFSMPDGAIKASMSFNPDPERLGLPVEYDGQTIGIVPTGYTDGSTFYFGASDATMSRLTGLEDSNPALFGVKITND